MVNNYNKLNLKVGEKVKYLINGQWRNAKVIKVGTYDYERGTMGWDNGDKYIEPTLEIELPYGTLIKSEPNGEYYIRRV